MDLTIAGEGINRDGHGRELLTETLSGRADGARRKNNFQDVGAQEGLTLKTRWICCCIDLDQRVLMFSKCNYPASGNDLLCAKSVTKKLNLAGHQRILISNAM
jgi:hypothetical protein